MEVLESNPTNFLVLTDEGEVEPITRTDTNTLLFDHNLWGVLRDGTDILSLSGTEDEPGVSVTPSPDAREFMVAVDDEAPAYLGEHWKSDFVEALRKTYDDDDRSVQPLLDLVRNLREMQIDPGDVAPLLTVEPFASAVEERMGGWLINDHLLLSWEGDFYHPGTTSRRVSGSSVARGSSDSAYEVAFGPTDAGQTTLDMDYETFVSKAAWAVSAAPKQ